MPTTISAIYRYPVKGLSAEALDRIALASGECLPQDRRFALALPSTQFDPAQPEWLSKTHFAMLMRDEKLAELRTRFDAETAELTVEAPEQTTLRARLTETEGRERLTDFLCDFLGDKVPQPLRVVEAPGHAFADARRKPNATTDKYVSLINLASIAELERHLGAAVDPLRFRANIYFEGAPAWHELEWIERPLRIGGARVKVIAAITRCAATEVNPATAERDLEIVAALRSGFGHNLMGIYAEVSDGGEIAVADEIA